MATTERGILPIFGLIRFSKREYNEQLRDVGLLHMKPLSYFVELESESSRGDPFEGTTNITQPKHIGEFTISSPLAGKIDVDPSELAGPIRISLNKTSTCNVYCMFAITQTVDGALVDERNIEFGDSFVLILNPTEFLNRVSLAARERGFRVECGLVDYYDAENYSGKTGRFKKRSIYSHQNEFRIVVEPGSEEPVNLLVGSLIDITSEVLPSSEANSLLDFTTKSFEEAGLK